VIDLSDTFICVNKLVKWWSNIFMMIIWLADTWGSHSKTIRKSSYGSAPSSGKSTPLPQPAEPSSSSSSGKGGRKTSGTRSGSTSRSNSRSNSAERRRSGGGTDDTASPTRKPALFDAFRPRSKSDASKRKPSIIANMKSAVQVQNRYDNRIIYAL